MTTKVKKEDQLVGISNINELVPGCLYFLKLPRSRYEPYVYLGEQYNWFMFHSVEKKVTQRFSSHAAYWHKFKEEQKS